jgi:uncharacterized membrane protein YeaQ/YmgE (transglycosylase-associated protein family)
MEFFTFSLIGLAAALIHTILPSRHHVGPASAAALGVFGALNGAMIVAAFCQGGWAILPPSTLLGAAIGALVSIGVLELVADIHVSRDEREAERLSHPNAS